MERRVMNRERMIGIVGGMGPEAGLDLARKILAQTCASRDQDHIALAMISAPSGIADRTAFLSGEDTENPGIAIGRVFRRLASVGAGVIGMPCNTAHSRPILRAAEAEIRDLDITFVHMIEEVYRFVRRAYPAATAIGLLSTSGTRRSGVYQDVFEAGDVRLVVPADDVQRELIQPAIYNETYGIKAAAGQVGDRARNDLRTAFQTLADRGAQAVILGCTEIPLAITEPEIAEIPVIDATLVLARALVREAAPWKLLEEGDVS